MSRDNTPAFPTENERQIGNDTWHYAGMSLRDYFAAKALAAMLANPNKEGINCGEGGLERFPRYAYEWADAMIAARMK